MNQRIYVILLLLAFSWSVCGEWSTTPCGSVTMDNQFFLNENLLTVRNRFTVENTYGDVLGSYHKKLLSLHTKYIFEDGTSTEVATAEKALISGGLNKYTITTCGSNDEWRFTERRLRDDASVGDVIDIALNGKSVAQVLITTTLRDYIQITGVSIDTTFATAKRSTTGLTGLAHRWEVVVETNSPVPPYVTGFLVTVLDLTADERGVEVDPTEGTTLI